MFNKKILLIEDDPGAKNELEHILKRKFKHVCTASDGLEGLERFKEESPDLVITDIRMPKMDGAELCKVIKEINPTQYVIAISAYSDSSYLVDLINTGVNRFVTKPINPKQLLEILEDEAENIDNKQMLKTYQDELESKNKELENSNTNLFKTVKIFENKMKQLSSIMHTCGGKEEKREVKKTKTDEELEKEQESLRYFIQEHNRDLEDLESEMDAVVVQMDIKKKIDEENSQKVGKYLHRYAAIISVHSGFGLGLLSEKMHILSDKMKECPQLDTINTMVAIEYLESIVFTLRQWREKIFANLLTHNGTEYYDDSMICDINTIILALENKADETEQELELF